MKKRRPGRKRGAVSLAAEAAPAASESGRGAAGSPCAAGPPHDVRGELAECPDAELIGAALAALDASLRRPGVVFDAPQRCASSTLHLAPRDREAFAVLFLDGQHALIEFAVLFEGVDSDRGLSARAGARRAAPERGRRSWRTTTRAECPSRGPMSS